MWFYNIDTRWPVNPPPSLLRAKVLGCETSCCRGMTPENGLIRLVSKWMWPSGRNASFFLAATVLNPTAGWGRKWCTSSTPWRSCTSRQCRWLCRATTTPRAMRYKLFLNLPLTLWLHPTGADSLRSPRTVYTFHFFRNLTNGAKGLECYTTLNWKGSPGTNPSLTVHSSRKKLSVANSVPVLPA